MRIEPYHRIDNINFGISQDAVIAILGKPIREDINRNGMLELEYSDGIYRFKTNGLFVEASIDSKIIEIGNITIPFKSLGAFLKENDNEMFECTGFLVSPAYGIAFDPKCASWVTVFPHEELEEWIALS